MTELTDYKPDTVSSPWECVRELIDEYIEDDRPIGERRVLALLQLTGVQAHFWRKREAAYRAWKEELK